MHQNSHQRLPKIVLLAVGPICFARCRPQLEHARRFLQAIVDFELRIPFAPAARPVHNHRRSLSTALTRPS